jgi:hydrogenase maturation protease
VGLGNPLAGSDGFGTAVLARLRAQGSLPAGVALVDAHTDLLGHIDDFVAYDDVVLVDAVLGAGTNGQVVVFDERTFSAWPDSAASCHHLSPLMALKLFRALHPRAATRLALVGYCTDEVTVGQGLPEAAAESGVEAITRWLVAD